MKTPMQELHHWVGTELKLDGYEHGVILDKIESMLEKEKQKITEAYINGGSEYCVAGWTPDKEEAEEYYNETFNTKDK